MYRGVWVGTEVEVKHVKNTKHQVSSDSHGNGSTNSQHGSPTEYCANYGRFISEKLYLPGLELIKGRSLEELLFNDDESSNTFTIQSCS